MKHCPICWSERGIRHAIADVKYWWNYSVLKKPKPDYSVMIKKVIPTMISTMVAIEVINEMMNALEEDDGRTRDVIEEDKEL